MTGRLTREEVLDLLARRIRSVLGPECAVTEHARFDQELHADSLDLVEIMEGVEEELAEGGVGIRLEDDELLSLRTVGQAVALILAGGRRRRGGAS